MQRTVGSGARQIIGFLMGVAALGAMACGPLGPLPGGQLSGTASPAPADWSFSDEVETVQLETRPEDPYSVNIWGAGLEDGFYIASGQGGDAEWAQHIGDNSDVRLRVGEAVYELRAVRVDQDTQAREAFLAAVKRKYEWTPEADDTENAWLYRLDPR